MGENDRDAARPYLDHAGGDAEFAAWLREADRTVQRAAGRSLLDLPARPWRNYYATRYEPDVAAREVLADLPDVNGPDYTARRDALVSAAAEAVERFGEDELERHAEALRREERPLPAAIFTVTYPNILRVSLDRMDAILREIDALLGHVDDTDPYQYEAAADRLFLAIRAAAEGGP